MRGVIPKDRNWREASPRWAIEAALEEIDALRLRGALQWPTAAKPKSEFSFGDYDKLHDGMPEARVYFVVNGRGDIEIVQFRTPTSDERVEFSKLRYYRTFGSPTGIGGQLIKTRNGRHVEGVVRGHYFIAREDALLYQLWLTCEDCARQLRKAHEAYDKEKART